MIATPRDLLLARRAKRAGAAYALRIIWEARAAGLPISLGFAIVEEESSDRVTRAGRNVYGHDDVRNRAPKGGLVTKANYLAVYKPDRLAGHGAQGVGLTQLTSPGLQTQADRLGGCWVPKNQLRVGFRFLEGLRQARAPAPALLAQGADGLASLRLLVVEARHVRVEGPPCAGPRSFYGQPHHHSAPRT
jgi:hypothetical protein